MFHMCSERFEEEAATDYFMKQIQIKKKKKTLSIGGVD